MYILYIYIYPKCRKVRWSVCVIKKLCLVIYPGYPGYPWTTSEMAAMAKRQVPNKGSAVVVSSCTLGVIDSTPTRPQPAEFRLQPRHPRTPVRPEGWLSCGDLPRSFSGFKTRSGDLQFHQTCNGKLGKRTSYIWVIWCFSLMLPIKPPFMWFSIAPLSPSEPLFYRVTWGNHQWKP